MRERFFDSGVAQKLLERMRPYGFRQNENETTPDFHSRFLMALTRLGDEAPLPKMQAEIFIIGLRCSTLQNAFIGSHRGVE